MARRLLDLVIERVALVPAGDDPEAQILLWKARRPEEEEAVEKENGMLRAIRSLGERRERATAIMQDVGRRADALLDPTGTEKVTKAEAAVAALRSAAERDLDRRPVDRSGRPRTIERALNDLASTRQGRVLMEAVRSEGAAADKVLRKELAMPEPEETPEPTPTAAEKRLEELAKARAKTSGLPWERELVEVTKTAEGRAILVDVARERELAS